MRVIAVEEAFVSRRFLDMVERQRGGSGFEYGSEMADLGATRLAEMDAGGIDMQVISHAPLGWMPLTGAQWIDLARESNDQLAAAVTAVPDRFAGFAMLPMAEPAAAVRELERAVGDLGFRGALINGRTGSLFLDDPVFFPVLRKAAELGVPVYLHPALPTEAVRREYYSGLDPEAGFALSSFGWGWHAETGLHVLRMIVAGVFERLPRLQLIIGHLGEMIPFMLDRVEATLTPVIRRSVSQRTVAETFRAQVSLTTSGFFSTPAFMLALEAVGAARVLFAVDYPYSSSADGRRFLDQLPISESDRRQVAHGNAERLLGLSSNQ